MNSPELEVGLLAIAAVPATALLARVFARASWAPIDFPNQRSLHSTPKPRVGGLAVFATFGLTFVVAMSASDLSTAGQVLPLLAPTAMVFACSAWEDSRGIPAVQRLGLHSVASALFLWWNGSNDVWLLPAIPMWVSFVGLGVFIVWMTNLYNFMDGADGLAGGMAAIGFTVVGVEAFAANVSHIGIIAVLIAASAAGFLLVNFPPARVFLGDAGSVPIGFLAAAASVQLASAGGVPLLQPVLAFAPFVLDATITILRRILAGSAFWRPHREHWYQRLIRRGWTHRRTVFVYYGLMLLSGTTSLLYSFSPLGAVLTVAVAHCLLPIAAIWTGRGPLDGVRI